MELVYQYLTGPRFRHRITAIFEKFSDMQQDLEKERKTMTRFGRNGKNRFVASLTQPPECTGIYKE